MSLNLIPPTSTVRAKINQPGSLHCDRHRFPRETNLIFGQDMTFALSSSPLVCRRVAISYMTDFLVQSVLVVYIKVLKYPSAIISNSTTQDIVIFQNDEQMMLKMVVKTGRQVAF